LVVAFSAIGIGHAHWLVQQNYLFVDDSTSGRSVFFVKERLVFNRLDAVTTPECNHANHAIDRLR
jgi:hypothetical protein